MMETVSEVFDMIARVAIALDAVPLTRWPAGWVLRVDARWKLVVNGSPEPIRWEKIEIPGFHCYAEYNGWPAGLFSPHGGIIAGGSVANEADLIRALAARLEAIN